VGQLMFVSKKHPWLAQLIECSKPEAIAGRMI
jgi:hypothetical protein